MENNTTINVTLDEAREWYNSGNETLKELALKCFPLRKLNTHNFENIKTFEDAVNELGKDIEHANAIVNILKDTSKATAAMYKLNIVRKALNYWHDSHLVKDPENSVIFYPYIPLITKDCTYYKNELNSGEMEVIGKIKTERKEYKVLGGSAFDCGGEGLACFDRFTFVCKTISDIGFLGCATKGIAEYFGKYFGMLITEARYGDLNDFKITEDKYENA